MIIVRFERFDKNAGKTSGGLFSSCTPMSDEGYAIKSRVGGMHQCPESDSAPGMRRFKAVVNGKKAIFGFTLEAFKNPELSRLLVRLAKLPEMRMKIFVNPNITWVSESGLQVTFTE